MAFSGFWYNTFYYKNSILSWMFPSYMASNMFQIFSTPRQLPPRPFEKEFLEKAKYNLLSIPTENYIKNANKFMKRKISPPDNLPKEIKVFEFLPENKEPNPITIICVHGWEGRSTNFYKFFKPLTDAGFRVLAPDFPMHGETKAEVVGLHLFSHSLNCIINYIGGDFYIIGHSLGNSTTCVTFYTANEEITKHILGFVAIGFGNLFKDYLMNFLKIVGLSTYAYDYFLDYSSENIGFDVRTFGNGNALAEMDIPVLIIHDENDKELPYTEPVEIAKLVKRKKYKVGDKEMDCLHLTKGLGHRRIIRDDEVIRLAVEFIVNTLHDVKK